MADYTTWSDYDLLEALELSGRLPAPDLIQACLGRDDLTPGLMDLLTSGTRAYWDGDDPRWYRDVHAGLLLIARREREALPVFEQILRDPGREKVVSEWFEQWLPLYGEALVPTLLDVACDPNVWIEGRASALRQLSLLGERTPSRRDAIRSRLRALLPALADDGALDVDDPSDEDRAVWTWTVACLADLGDLESQEQAEALYEAELLYEDETGDIDDYYQVLETPPSDEPEPLPDARQELYNFYETMHHWNTLSDQDLMSTVRAKLVEAGADDAAAARFELELAALLADGDPEADEDVAAAILDRLAASLRAQGIPDERIPELLSALLEESGQPLDPFDFEGLEDELAETEGLVAREAEALALRRDRNAEHVAAEEDYTAWDTYDLLEALELAGRYPGEALLRAALIRREDLTPGLLRFLEAEFDEETHDAYLEDDPRWYRAVHAALLLLAYREPAALVLFDRFLRDESWSEFNEWFVDNLSGYGPMALTMFEALLADETAWVWGRIAAGDSLGNIARAHPDTRPRVLEALRSQLPATPEAVTPGVIKQDELASDQELFETVVVFNLAQLQDTESREVVEALFAHHRLDVTHFGDVTVYREMLDGHDPFPEEPTGPFDLLAFYDTMVRRDAIWGNPDEVEEFVDEFEDDYFDDDDFYEADDAEERPALAGLSPAASFVRETPKVGRNEPCPCGSGKKYKKCCGRS